jgi:hypothetical protein
MRQSTSLPEKSQNGPMPSLPDPSRIPDDQWIFDGVSQDGLRRHYVYWVDKEKGLGFRKTENLVEEELLARNRDSLNESYGKRFRDDPIGTRIASIPLNVFYRDLAPRLKQGDGDYVKWFLNSDQNRPYRTFRGKV